jgi:hypothetical protein
MVFSFLIGCTPVSNENNAEIVEIQVTEEKRVTPTYNFRTSQPGFTTVKGEMIVRDPTVSVPDPNDAIFLVPISTTEMVSSIPFFKVGEVPQADVDEATGLFQFTNITPGTYALMVLTIGNAQIPARPYGESGLVIVKVSEEDLNKTIDLEKVAIP